MKMRQKTTAVVLLVLVGVVAAGLLLTPSEPDTSALRSDTGQPAAFSIGPDQRLLDTAQRLQVQADTPREQAMARNVVAIADQNLDLAFAGALREVAARSADASDREAELEQRVSEAENNLHEMRISLRV